MSEFQTVRCIIGCIHHCSMYMLCSELCDAANREFALITEETDGDNNDENN